MTNKKKKKEIKKKVYNPISVVYLTAAIVFRLHLFSNDRAVHPTLQIKLHYYLFFFQYNPTAGLLPSHQNKRAVLYLLFRIQYILAPLNQCLQCSDLLILQL